MLMPLFKRRWQDWVNMILGVWTFMVPWIFTVSSVSPDVMWNFWIVGVVVFFTSFHALDVLKPWEEWVNLAAGIWLFLSPWFFSYTNVDVLQWNAFIVGLIIALDAILELPNARRLQERSGFNRRISSH